MGIRGVFGRLSVMLAVCVGATALVLAGCGSDKDSSTTATGGGGSSTQATGDAALPPAPPDNGADVAGAQDFVKSNLQPLAYKPAGPAYDMKKVDKPVWWLSPPTSAPPVLQRGEGFKQAAKAAGVKYHVCLAEGTPEGNALCLKQAVNAGAGSAIVDAISVDSVLEPIKRAEAAGVKVVVADQSDPGKPVNPAVTAEVTHDYHGTGEMAGAYAVAAKGGELDALCINVPDFVTGTSVCAGFTDKVHEFCPDCKVETKDIPAANALTQVGALVNQAVLSDPKLNFIMNAYDYTTPPVATALRSMGKGPNDILLGGENGTVEALAAVKKGQYNAVSVGQHPYWWGWGVFDAGARAQAGAIDKTAQLDVPNKLFTTESMKGYDGPITYQDADTLYDVGDGSVYKDGFQNVWKASN